MIVGYGKVQLVQSINITNIKFNYNPALYQGPTLIRSDSGLVPGSKGENRAFKMRLF